MRFRQNAIAWVEMQAFLIFLIVISLVVMLFSNRFDTLSIVILTATIVVGVWGCYCLGNRYIIIGEKGISCNNSRGICWEFQWNEITELKRSTQFRNPAIIVVPNTEYLRNREGVNRATYYFQLSKKAKLALEFYSTRLK